ncbi:MEF2-activating motif and SAP domain-containing transcriptional regulator isoform X4 [Equus przewalskii]|uniref:MEF2-activating motif and SAP domain-containing transcriptional regulator isoform X4 n=1 Tax=Equus przewalskii TaxID=9798 RepID=A0ABM4JE51_EQUPR
MTLAASSQRSQIIRSKFRSVLQLRIHRRYQDPTLFLPAWPAAGGLSGFFTASPVSDPDPWISASGPALAPAPALPMGPAPSLFSPGVLLPEPEYCPWRSLKKESPKISQQWREPKPEGNLTHHQYMPPEPRQGSRTDPQTERSALGPPGSPLWEGTNSQQPPPRMKPTPVTASPPGIPSPSPPPHKMELQTLKLEELTVSELRQQLRLRGLPVSGTKSMLLERMRGDATPRERPKPRREDSPAGARWPRLRPKTQGAARRPGSLKPSSASHQPPLPRAAETLVTAPAPAPALTPSSAPALVALTLEEELQEAIRRAQLLPNRGIDDILEGQVEPNDPLPPIPLDFPGSFDVLSPSPDSEGLSSVFSSSLPSPTSSPSPSPRGPTDSLDWLEALSGGPPLGNGPPAPSIFSADLSYPSGTRLWDLLEDPC